MRTLNTPATLGDLVALPPHHLLADKRSNARHQEGNKMTAELHRHLDQAAAALDTATTMQEYATAIIQAAYWKTELDRQEAST